MGNEWIINESEVCVLGRFNSKFECECERFWGVNDVYLTCGGEGRSSWVLTFSSVNWVAVCYNNCLSTSSIIKYLIITLSEV